MNAMQKSTCKYLTFTIYRHVALLGCHHGDDDGRGGGWVGGWDGESPAVPSIVHAVEFLGEAGYGVGMERLKCL